MSDTSAVVSVVMLALAAITVLAARILDLVDLVRRRDLRLRVADPALASPVIGSRAGRAGGVLM